MPDIHIYIDNETFNLVKNLGKGEPSLIFRRAIKEHCNVSDNLETVKKNMDLLEQEQNVVNAKLTFLQKRKEQLEALEEEKRQDQAKLKEQEQQALLKEKEKNSLRNAHIIEYTFNISLEEAKKLALEWNGRMLKQFAESKGLTYDVKKYQEAYEKVRSNA